MCDNLAPIPHHYRQQKLPKLSLAEIRSELRVVDHGEEKRPEVRTLQVPPMSFRNICGLWFKLYRWNVLLRPLGHQYFRIFLFAAIWSLFDP